MPPTPDPARWAQIKALFDTTADLPAAARGPRIAAAGLPPDALAELHSLLANHDLLAGRSGFLADSAAQALVGSAAQAGQRLGDWEIVRAIGSGGMGEVFEARRADGQYQGRAAVKLLKRGMDSAAVLQRFALERQALARLNHPHIARLLDAGASADGLPYFVLEFIDGQPIDAAVRPLPLEQRLQLFLQLADAVAHAHRNLLVHRDLKPGNVLVDQDGQVKLLDFGIAKALDPLEGLHGQGGRNGDTTVGGVRPLTPHYASPEQVRGDPVGTATDIYSLGVLLYQLLTGTRPTGRHATTPAEAARSVLEDEPTRPSRLSASEAVDPHWLRTRKRLAGDLDNILLKTLEKSADRRYPSVDALAADIRLYLGGWPVSARQTGWRDRLAKRVARNPLASSLLAAGVVVLVAGVAGVGWQAHVARQAQRLAEARLAEVRSVTHTLVFGFGDTVEYLPGGMKIKADLFQETLAALQRLAPTLGSDTALQSDIAQMHVRLAEAYAPGYPVSLNDPARARVHAEEAVRLFNQLWPVVRQQGDARLSGYASRACTVLASEEARAGRQAEAVALNRQGLAWAQEGLAAARPGSDTLLLRGAVTAGAQALAVMLDDNGVGLGRHQEALALYRTARASGLQELGMAAEIAAVDAKSRPEQTRYAAELRQTLGVINGSLSSSLVRRGDYAGAAQARAEAVAHLREAQQTHPQQVQFQASLAASLRQLAGLQLLLDQDAAAAESIAESMAWTDRLLATDRANAEWLDDREFATLVRGSILARLGRDADALPWLERGQAYWHAEQARQPAPRAQRSAAIAEFRAWRSRARLAGGADAARAWQAAAAAADRLQALAVAAPQQAEVWLLRAEAEQALASDGPVAGRGAWQALACASWVQAAALRPLPPSAQRQRAC